MPDPAEELFQALQFDAFTERVLEGMRLVYHGVMNLMGVKLSVEDDWETIEEMGHQFHRIADEGWAGFILPLLESYSSWVLESAESERREEARRMWNEILTPEFHRIWNVNMKEWLGTEIAKRLLEGME